MSQTAQQTMSCGTCGLKYPWKQENVGKKFKCKCGAVMVAPAKPDGGAVNAAVAKMVPNPPAAAQRPAAQAAPRAAGPAKTQTQAKSVSPAAPKRSATPARPAAPVGPDDGPAIVDLQDDGAGDMYDIANDLEAPPALDAPAPAAPAAHRPVGGASKTSNLPRGGKAAVPAFPGYKPKHVDDKSEQKAQIKKLLIPLIAIAVLVGIVVVVRNTGLMSGGSSKQYDNLPGEDGRFHRIADEDGSHEAKAWLAENNSRGVAGFFWTRDKTEKKVDQWYSEGAKNVFAFGSVMTATLAIELPDDPAKRKSFIDYANQFNDEHNRGKPTITDVGQKYILLDFI